MCRRHIQAHNTHKSRHSLEKGFSYLGGCVAAQDDIARKRKHDADVGACSGHFSEGSMNDSSERNASHEQDILDGNVIGSKGESHEEQTAHGQRAGF